MTYDVASSICLSLDNAAHGVALFAAGFLRAAGDAAWARRRLLAALVVLRLHWRARGATRRKRSEAILALRYLNLAGVHRQGFTLLHVRAQLEQHEDTFMS
jgi:hypothetical protein